MHRKFIVISLACDSGALALGEAARSALCEVMVRWHRQFMDDLDDIVFHHPAFVAAFEAIPTAAFVVTADGAIVTMNAVGRAALARSEQAIRATLARAVRSPSSEQQFSFRKIGEWETRGRYLAVRLVDREAPQARARVLASQWRLTRRQTEVLALLAQGGSNKEIAAALGCAEVTVEFHVTALLRKAGVDGRAVLIARFWTERICPA
jgi:DNA-binding NarL/FixJ family response regulator